MCRVVCRVRVLRLGLGSQSPRGLLKQVGLHPKESGGLRAGVELREFVSAISQVTMLQPVWGHRSENCCLKEGEAGSPEADIPVSGGQRQTRKLRSLQEPGSWLHDPLICAGHSGHRCQAMMNSTHLSRGPAVWKAPLHRSIRFLLTVLLSQFQNQSNSVVP